MNQKELEEKIKYHQDLYYSGAEAEITDSEFDKLWEELKINYPDSELLKEVGDSALTNENKYKHVIHMGSQEKVTSEDGLRDWIRLKKIVFPVVIQEKCDGSSVELHYKKGTLFQALTRGDGIYGRDITENVKLMNVPLSIPDTAGVDDIYVRGEIILPTENISKLKGFDTIKNPRNIASGIANQKDTKDNLELLTVVCYDIYSNADETSKIIFLKKNGFRTCIHNDIAYRISDIFYYINKIKEEKDENSFPYQIDGSVIKQNVKPLNVDTTKMRPDWQRAYKYRNEEFVTDLLDVEWSRNGHNFTPVAILKPVEIDGTTVSRASLANLAEVRNLGIKTPCSVVIAKANQIIPKVYRVIRCYDDSREVEVPIICPVCGSKLKITDSIIQCVNPSCGGKSEHKLAKWIDTVGALGFGPAAISYLTDNNITEIKELYCNDVVSKLIEKYPAPKALQKAFANLWAKSYNMELYDFISGFDLAGLGSRVVKLLTDAGYDTYDKLKSIKYEDLMKIQGFAEGRSKLFVEQMKMLSNEMEEVLNTKRVTIKNNKKSEEKKEDKKSMTFCITGKLTKPRKEYEDMITSMGHKLGSSVTSNTNYLVNNDIDSTSSKNVTAKKLGVPIINEEEFLKIING